MLNMLLRSELLGVDAVTSPKNSDKGDTERSSGFAMPPPVNLFRFKSAAETISDRDPRSVYELSPVGGNSKRLLTTPRKAKRKIPKVMPNSCRGQTGGICKSLPESQNPTAGSKTSPVGFGFRG